jgi:hypothetical protein
MQMKFVIELVTYFYINIQWFHTHEILEAYGLMIQC